MGSNRNLDRLIEARQAIEQTRQDIERRHQNHEAMQSVIRQSQDTLGEARRLLVLLERLSRWSE